MARTTAIRRPALSGRDADGRIRLALGGLAAAGIAVAAGRLVLEALRREGPDPHSDQPPGPRPVPTAYPRPAAGRSRAYRLGRGEPAGAGLARIAVGRLDHAADELEGRAREDRAEAIHEARKDLKKLRAVLRLARKRVGDDTYRRENDHLRDAGRLLSGARDAQVRLELLDELVASGAVPGDRVAGLRAMLQRERGATRAEDSVVADAASRIAVARDRAPRWPLAGDGWGVLGPGLARSYRRGRDRIQDAVERPTVENLHEWRKRVKDLWYHLRILAPAWPAVLEPLADEAHRLSELLGDDHDLAVLAASARDRLRSFDDPADLDLLLDAVERRRSRLLGDAFGLGRRLYADKPGAFERRLETWWEASREGIAQRGLGPRGRAGTGA